MNSSNPPHEVLLQLREQTEMHLNPSQMGLHQDQQQQQIQNPHQMQQTTHFENPTTHDDFLDQMLSSMQNWPPEVLSGSNPKSPWDTTTTSNKLFNIPIGNETNKPNNRAEDPSPEALPYPYDESVMLASRLRQHQISAGASSPKSMMLQQQLMMSRGGGGGMDNSGLFPLPLTLGNGDRSRDDVASGDGLFNGLAGSMAPRTGQAVNQHFQHPQQPPQSFGAAPPGINQGGSGGGGGGTATVAPVRQKVRARRGQATDPHSIAERLRRERIAERMKALQELVPNANKTDKASMLDEIIDYVKFLQLQVKVLSMSRLGGAAAVAPLVADMSSEGGGDCIQASGGRSGNGAQTASTNDSLSVTEHQVAKLMEEDMGSAMQYLQGKGLCLMPISLASAISSATCHSRTHAANANSLMGASNGGDGPSSPSMSVLTVQSATIANGVTSDTNGVKDSTSVSKP
ncbi:hypothetical protein Sjap_019060 [Stephania japonica]|uniref:BHLH domain-containing protein n=1 Tax=Stephania japonica TaxID=461633 RepID=A0AAP0HYZ8_9MAGN